MELRGALPTGIISEKQYPKVYAWISRFRAAIKLARARNPKPVKVTGTDAAAYIAASPLRSGVGHDEKQRFDRDDPLGLNDNAAIEVWPLDTGSSHHDRGRLVALNKREVIFAVPLKDAPTEAHVHVPRWNYRVKEIGKPDLISRL